MVPVDKALEIVLSHTPVLPAEEVDLPSAVGRVLAEDVHADLDMPPFDRSAMDGYAVRAADVAHAPVVRQDQELVAAVAVLGKAVRQRHAAVRLRAVAVGVTAQPAARRAERIPGLHGYVLRDTARAAWLRQERGDRRHRHQ